MQIKSKKEEVNSKRSYQLKTIKVTGNSKYIQEFKIKQIKEIKVVEGNLQNNFARS